MLALLRFSYAPTPQALTLAEPDVRLGVDDTFTQGPQNACLCVVHGTPSFYKAALL